MKELVKEFIKWFKCKMCCSSKCSVGEDMNEEHVYYDYYSGRRKSI